MKVTVWHPTMPSSPTADEADSLAQALSVWEALTELGLDAIPLAFNLTDLPSSIDALLATRPETVFNLVEETEGQRALNFLPAQILEALAIDFTGNDAEAMTLTTHKVATKALLRSHGLPTPQWIASGNHEVDTEEGPFLIKPVTTDASQGIIESDLAMYQTATAARAALRHFSATNGGNGLFAEQFIDGREFNLSIIEFEDQPLVLPAAEMCFVDYPPDKPRIVGYNAKWDPESFEYTHTCRRFDLPPADGNLVEGLRSMAIDCWELFHLRGYARVDFRVDEAGDPWILEINTNPGIAPDAGLPAAAAAAGLDYRDLVGRIVDAAHPMARVHAQR